LNTSVFEDLVQHVMTWTSARPTRRAPAARSVPRRQEG
jgi:hypothetical protein